MRIKDEIIKHKLELLEEDDPEYYSLINESNEIVKEYSRIIKLAHSFKLPTIKIWRVELPRPCLFYKTKAELSIIGREGISLTNHYLNWNNRALTFCVSPSYSFSSDPEVDKQTTVILYTNLLLHRTDRVNSGIKLLQSSYNLRFSEIGNEINYWIAITARGFTFLGFIISKHCFIIRS
ncbi:MAG: hypothetical protein HYW01_08315 [Deltaproteobacteria bacterium]|nr:hypothetical protein [Deltaproteobacteria bacterium]